MAVKVFISYSHKDEPLRDSLAAHLSGLEWEGIISSWYDRQLTAGTEWDDKIKAELESADIILLLISPDFIASKYCREEEIPRALKRHESKQAYVVPVILRPFHWSDTPFAKLQAFPKDAKPVTSWPNQDEAFLSVTQGIRTAAKLLLDYRRQQAEQKKANRAQYQQKVEEFLQDGKGEISWIDQDTLDELAEELGLTIEEAEAIQSQARELYERYKANLEKYKRTLIRSIQRGDDPSNQETKRALERRQRDLGLKPEDVARISKPILDQAELDEQAKQQRLAEAQKLQELELQRQRQWEEYRAKLEHYRQEFSKAVEAEYPLHPAALENLKAFQHQLELKDEDVEAIATPILAAKQAEYERQQSASVDLGNGVILEMVKIPADEFLMGAATGEESFYDDERPQHRVKVPEFWMGKFAVTQEQWSEVAGLPKVKIDLNPEPSYFNGAKRPVEQVSWDEAVEFCDRLSRETGKSYRLPTEAEWEYACRAGTTTPFSFGETITPDLVNFNGDYTYGNAPKGAYRRQTTDVGSFPANAFGLYDVHGNVWEWCADQWYGSYANKPDLLKQNGAIAWT
ncbi:MAG: SUMF1/EgtB/PvdO family nonheme iron enzyme, partial [Leptolyngbyaceae cyanobacterium SL_5_9]|nr:SUMF1/EgtB/PvdO family nonheme iron enzyme [Leptolyngbyaceae cyanobacterium SL_5_9]